MATEEGVDVAHQPDVNLIHIYKNILTGICDHIERDACIPDRSGTEYLTGVMALGVSYGVVRSYYQLHAMFACFAETDGRTTFEHIWDTERGWMQTPVKYFNFS